VLNLPWKVVLRVAKIATAAYERLLCHLNRSCNSL
jgi:hypothetical protein